MNWVQMMKAFGYDRLAEKRRDNSKDKMKRVSTKDLKLMVVWSLSAMMKREHLKGTKK